jgi:MFS family permease
MRIPAQASAVSRWFGPEKRSTALGICFSGGQVGLATGAIAASFLLSRFGWHSVFYSIGGASLLLTLLWFTLFPEKKVGHASVMKPGNTDSGLARVSLLTLLRYRATWGIAFGQMGYLYAYYVFVNWLPGYLVIERKMSILRTGLVASLPFWAGMVGTIGGGWLGDVLIRHGFSVTASRKTIIGVGMSLSAITVISAAFTPQTWLAVTLLTLCMGSLRATTGAANSLPIDLAPTRAVAALTSIQNFTGNISGLLAPIVTGYLLQATGSFVIALVVAGGMVFFGAASYLLIVGRVEPLDIAGRSPLSS